MRNRKCNKKLNLKAIHKAAMLGPPNGKKRQKGMGVELLRIMDLLDMGCRTTLGHYLPPMPKENSRMAKRKTKKGACANASRIGKKPN